MNIIYKEDNEGINFVEVHDILVHAFNGRAFLGAEDIKKSFLNSQYVIYALDDTKLIGVGRAIADSEWAIIYNIALLPEYHKLGIGKTLINKLVSQLKGHHIFVYTHPKTVSMYETLGFNRSKQAFRYVGLDSEEEVNRREEVGFYLPYGYKFEEEFYKEKRKATIKKENVSIRYSSKLADASFEDIAHVLEVAFGGKRDVDATKADFLASQNFELAFDGDKLVGCARLLTDGVKEAILLNVAVDPEYQGLGIASKIVNNLALQVPGYEIFLHTHPGSTGFYSSHKEYRRFKTAFIYNDGDLVSTEIGKKFALPVGFRYVDEFYKSEIKYKK